MPAQGERMKLSSKEREALKQMFGGRCAYCGWKLDTRWCADHVAPIYRKMKLVKAGTGEYTHKLVATGELYHPERDTKDNLFPCCAACNIHKSSLALETWRSQLEDIIGILRRGYPTFRHAVRFGQVIERPGPIVFFFEQYRKQTQA
jgi:hypothetical protein